MSKMRYRLVLILTLLCANPALAQSYDREVAQVARQTLAALQSNSFAANREYCGLIGENQAGQLVVTRARKGRTASCRPRNLPRDVTPLASYHTHGRYTPRDDTEVPSYQDVEGDMGDGLNGYVATPGGRLWLVDGATGLSHLLCDLGCLPQDPRFEPESDPAYFVKKVFTLRELRDRQN